MRSLDKKHKVARDREAPLWGGPPVDEDAPYLERHARKYLAMTTRDYFVYILANPTRMLYVGVTNDLKRRLYEHRNKLIPGYTRQYSISRLVFFETTPNVSAAIAREKQIKGWIRIKKLALIESQNPAWSDLSAAWYEPPGAGSEGAK